MADDILNIVVRENNLYRNGKLYNFPDEGEMLLLREKLVLQGTVYDEYHTVRYEDRIDLIAYKYYARTVKDASKYWWVIADANSIDEPLDLSDFVGKQILIPNILNVLLLL